MLISLSVIVIVIAYSTYNVHRVLQVNETSYMYASQQLWFSLWHYFHYFEITRGFVQEFCTHCPVCQLSQPQNTRPPLHPVIEKDFLDRVQVDLMH